MANGPSIKRIKAEKRGTDVGVAPAGVTRRRFLTFLGAGAGALGLGSACAGGQEGQQGAATGGGEEQASAGSNSGGGETNGGGGGGVGNEPTFFRAIEATDRDDISLPEGYKYDIIRSSGDDLGGGLTYGDHNDYVAYFPIDVLDGGDSSEDGLLWVNHEYINPLFWSDYTDLEGATEKTREQIQREKQGVGGSVIRVRKEGDTWSFAEDEEYTRRIDATTPMDVTGPGNGSSEMRMEDTDEVIGTLANCGGGVTPWNTVLTCEENFQDYYGGRTDDQGEPGNGTDDAPEALEIAETYRWLDDRENAQPPEHYGWIVEIDPFDRESKPRKHTWLGRIRHENAAITLAADNRVVVYTGHDENSQRIYKFISSGTYDENDREGALDLLTDGMLYVADFANGAWVAMDYENNPVFKDNGFSSQADVLVRAAEAASLAEEEGGDPIGTPLDRCEDIEVASDGRVYAALTNNTDHGNFYGQIFRLTEADDDAAAEEFTFEVFAAGGPQTGFASPDNLMFDDDDNLWVVTDISSSSLGSGIYSTFRNNGAFVLPSGIDSATGSDVYQFASAPIEAELTGPYFTPDGNTLFMAVQHPGEESEDPNEPTSTWPDGDEPKSSVVAITGFEGQRQA